MDVCPSFIANLPSPVSVQPRMGSLDDPTVAPQLLRAFYPPSCDSRLNPPLPQCLPLLRCIIGLIGMQLLGPLAGPASGTPDRFDGIDHRDVVDIGRREGDGQRDAVPIDPKMALRARFSEIRRIRPGRFAPRGQARWLNLKPPETSRSGLLPPADLATPGASASKPHSLASISSAANRSCRFHSPSPGGASPRESPSSARTRSPSAPSGLGWAVFPLSAWAWGAEEGAGSPPTTHRRESP